MNARRISGALLRYLVGPIVLHLLPCLLQTSVLQAPLFRILDRRLNHALARSLGRIQRERLLMIRAIAASVSRLTTNRQVSSHVLRVISRLWGRVWLGSWRERPQAKRFQRKFGATPPWFLVVAPTQACNLHCDDCYADANASKNYLSWPVLNRILTEAQSLWAAPLVVFSGGEPLAYCDQGKGIWDLLENHHELLSLVFTNGTLVDRTVAQRMASLGNVTPAVSVEGLQQRTDARRGPGTFQRILEAMALLRSSGVPFGISVTVTAENLMEVTSDEFLEFFFTQQGAFYGFLFHYMPIGRAPDFRSVPTPAQRLQLWRRTWKIIEEKRFFLFDFWNHGPIADGCLSAGRGGGYLYINGDGKVMPCVFAPYSAANMVEIYRTGGNLNDAWRSPLFSAIRQWQENYRVGRGPETEGNLLSPCPIRDHYPIFREWIDKLQPQPENQAAQDALVDSQYAASLSAYGQDFACISTPVWQKEYLGRSTPSADSGVGSSKGEKAPMQRLP
jgi:MoaA/NifB/PqqE/SkfB family radical SAM enzyme